MPADVETMAYVGETPWHSLGNKVHHGVSIERMMIEAGLEWEVHTRPVLFQPFSGLGDPTALTETERLKGRELWRDTKHRVMFRNSDNHVLDIVGPEYIPVQNSQVLEFFREYVDAGDMELETAGSLQQGRYVWALAKMKAGFTLLGDDKVDGYIFLANPHQYGKGYIVKFTTVRIVCSNTLMMALGGGGAEFKMWHTREFNKELQDEAKRRLGIARERLESFHEDADELARRHMSVEQATAAIARVFAPKLEKEPLEKQSPTVKRIIDLYNGRAYGANLVSSNGTAWGVLNAATQYLDHEYGKSADARITNAWLGEGDTKKRRLLSDLLALTT